MDELLRRIERATAGEFSADYGKDDLVRLLTEARNALKAAPPPALSGSAARFAAFQAALEDLCILHGVQLCTSGYDGLQLWPLQAGEEPVHANGFENCIPDGA